MRTIERPFILYLLHRGAATLALCATFALSSPLAAAATLETANVMAPLDLKDSELDAFRGRLATVKSYGIDAVSVDVWFGKVEAARDNQFDWSYYDRIFREIKDHGLKIVPILSFHQCGGNVGDECNVPLPDWIWKKYDGKVVEGVRMDARAMQYKSEYGNYSPETLQLWVDALVANEYIDFTKAFASHFASYESSIIEVNVSAGPAGELRYPSYNHHDCRSDNDCLTGYPTRGGLQAYSELARIAFRKSMLAKYGTVDAVNQAWKTRLADANGIQPPADGGAFFRSGDYKNAQYGRDFIDWYNQSLVDHGRFLVSTVITSLAGSLPSAKIGFKIPGVHWAMVHPTYPRAAEIAAGLIQTSVDFNSDGVGHGYSKIVGLAKKLASPGREIVLHFTCLEMDDQNQGGSYSQAKSLVFWVAAEAKRQGVTIKGENALPGGVQSDHGWDNIANAFQYASYTGLTTLRIDHVASGIGQGRYSAFIRQFRNTKTDFPSLFVRGTNNGWTTTPMTKVGDVWTVSNVRFGSTSNERFKFDVAKDWSENYGGNGLSGLAVRGGNDIAVQADGVYNISFDQVSKTYSAVAVTKPSDPWYFLGTPNSWRGVMMDTVAGRDTRQITVTFAKEDVRPRFKLAHDLRWTESYPQEDMVVNDCANYQISFEPTTKQIALKKMGDVTTGACAASTREHLGVTFGPQSSTFALWSPDSADVQLVLDGKHYPMAPADSNGNAGVYKVSVPGNHHLKQYSFVVAGREARDPYGVMVDPNTKKNIVIDLGKTGPDGGWVARPALKEREDAVIYEVHVRDFTIDESSGVDAKKRGKFLGMVQAGTTYEDRASRRVFTTGLDHLKELGVTHVQILPIFNFRACSFGSPASCYNWGYDPLDFNVPEERYSTSKDPVKRINELKTMINELHRAQIRVVMDVVYNHTAAQTPPESTFSPISQKYFTGTNLSGTGNALDASQPMVSTFIRDSLDYWVSEYHVDGFRFDLIGVFDYAAVGEWGRYLNQRYPGAGILVYGEPWNGYAKDTREGQRVRLGTVARIADAHVGVFNSKFREALKGTNNNSGEGGGYVFNRPEDGSSLWGIQVGSRGSIRAGNDPFQIIDTWDAMFAADPEQSINYVSAHDNLVLRDRILAWAKRNGSADNSGYLKRIQEFANGIILTSQGIPFLHAGDEMLRTKGGDSNSYESPDSVNKIRWSWKAENQDVVRYYKQMISLRKSHPGFRMTTWDQVQNNIQSSRPQDGIVVNKINAQANGDSWKSIIVIYNSGGSYEYALPAGRWHVAAERSDAGAGNDREVTGSVTAEGTAVTIVYQ